MSVETYTPGVTLDVGRDAANAAFELAINTGRLSREPGAENYAGRFMFMGHSRGRALFKHQLTREYLP